MDNEGRQSMSTRVTILNGPNLNLLGVREPRIYGSTTLASIESSCRRFAEILGVSLTFRQSNHEGVLIDWVQEAREGSDGIIINPAAYTFTSVALLDALKMFDGPIIELHISNIHAREATYHHSRISPMARAVICGLGAYGYLVAVQSMAQMLNALPDGASLPARIEPE
jgi:3-dehydroquinate dehydratase-2